MCYTESMKTKVYFDGACHLCSREMDHYRKKDTQNLFEFIDITAPSFSAAKEGLDPKQVNLEMHVRDSAGNLHTGVNAFIEIWRIMPGYEWMSKASSLPLIHPALKVGYFCFARLRPYLPKRKSNHCDSGTCAR